MMGAQGSADVAGDPCGPLRGQAETECAQAVRRADTARHQKDELRRVRQELVELEAEAAPGKLLGDPRALWEAKDGARSRYRDRIRAARGMGAGHASAAAAEWLREVDRLNRGARDASPLTADVNRRRAELEVAIARLELAADGARVAAEAAAVSCREWRDRLTECEESESQRRGEPGRGPTGSMRPPDAPAGSPIMFGPQAAIVALLQGHPGALPGLSLRVAEETGTESGVAHRLLVELRDGLRVAALRDCALTFQPQHPFWGQFGRDEARSIASALLTLGHGFDGLRGWAGEPAETRHLAMALAHVGYGFRSVRHPSNAAEMATLWQGTEVDAVGHLKARAPDLSPAPLAALLGSTGPSLQPLWDQWGRIRALLARDFGPPPG